MGESREKIILQSSCLINHEESNKEIKYVKLHINIFANSFDHFLPKLKK
jgi:predicted oxidoreductase